MGVGHEHHTIKKSGAIPIPSATALPSQTFFMKYQKKTLFSPKIMHCSIIRMQMGILKHMAQSHNLADLGSGVEFHQIYIGTIYNL